MFFPEFFDYSNKERGNKWYSIKPTLPSTISNALHLTAQKKSLPILDSE